MERRRSRSSSFFHGKPNSCGVLTVYFKTKTFTAKKQQADKEGHISILNVSISGLKTSR